MKWLFIAGCVVWTVLTIMFIREYNENARLNEEIVHQEKIMAATLEAYADALINSPITEKQKKLIEASK
jgi:hypothetical protein